MMTARTWLFAGQTAGRSARCGPTASLARLRVLAFVLGATGLAFVFIAGLILSIVDVSRTAPHVEGPANSQISTRLGSAQESE